MMINSLKHTLLLACLLCSGLQANWIWKKPVKKYNGVFDKKIETSTDSAMWFYSAIMYYKKNVSPLQGERCPCFPTCSSYTLYSMLEFGFFTGFIIGADRIFIRESDDMFKGSMYFKTNENSYLKGGYYDIPEANNLFVKKDWRYIDPGFYRVLFRESGTNH